MNRLKDFFYYSRTERNGTITLISILLLLLLLPYTYSCFSAETVVNFSPWKADIAAFEEGVSQKPLADNSSKKWNVTKIRGQKTTSVSLKPQKFDPNTVSPMDLAS